MAEARSIAALTISFGLVSIPVRLFSATVTSEKISFNLLHEKDGSRLKQQYICAKDGKVVPREEMVKGYEFAKDQYVIFTPEELKALEEAGSPDVGITDFVPLDSVDPVFFDKTYYLAPDKGGAKPYSLLTTALADSKRCAVGRWAARGREHVVIVRPVKGGLAMHQLHFRAEVREIKELGIEHTELKDAELKLALQIIDQQSSKAFDPNEYKDEVRERVEAAIQRKVQGEEVAISSAPPKSGGNVVDLMEALKASLKGSSSRSARPEPKEPAKRAAAASSEKLGERKAPRRVTTLEPAKKQRRSTRA